MILSDRSLVRLGLGKTKSKKTSKIAITVTFIRDLLSWFISGCDGK